MRTQLLNQCKKTSKIQNSTIFLMTLILSVFITINIATAQNQPIINGVETFGIWDSCSAGELPQYWDGFNRQIIIGGMNMGDIICVEKDSADPQDIDYSVSLNSTSILGGPAVPGMLTTGNLNISFTNQNGDIDGGIPYSQKPATLKGWYKYNPSGTDSALISVWFQKNGVKIGGGVLKLHSQKTIWTEFEVELNYQPNIMPDTMNILFASSTLRNNCPVGSRFEIDHIWFEGGSLGFNRNQELINSSKIYPNPATSHINIEVNEEISEYKVTIYNELGQIVAVEICTSKQTKLNTQSLKKGLYFVEIIHKNLRKIQKIIIR